MNRNEQDQHERWQEAAARAERDASPMRDPQVDAYRLLLRALRQPPPAMLPPDFARSVLQRWQAREESAGIEMALMRFLACALTLVGVFTALPAIAAAIATSLHWLSRQPLPASLLLVAAFGMVAVALVDRLWQPLPQLR